MIKKQYRASINVLWDATNISALNARQISQGKSELTEAGVESLMGEQLFRIIKGMIKHPEQFEFQFRIERVEVEDEEATDEGPDSTQLRAQ